MLSMKKKIIHLKKYKNIGKLVDKKFDQLCYDIHLSENRPQDQGWCERGNKIITFGCTIMILHDNDSKLASLLKSLANP